MSVKSMKNYSEWPYWHELAETMAVVATFRIVHNGICNYGWSESASAVIDMTRDDLVDYIVKQKMSNLKMANSPDDFFSVVGGFGTDIDLSNDSALVAQSSGLVGYLFGHESVEPLPCTSAGKAWARMVSHLAKCDSIKALLTFASEWSGGATMKERLQKYGLLISSSSSAYMQTESSFKEAYPSDFKRGFWASVLG